MKTQSLICVTLLTLTGCASIISQTDYPVSMNSSPDAASFTVTNANGQTLHTGTTPALVTLPSSSGYFAPEKYRITFNKPGYAEQTELLRGKLNNWYFGNLVFGGLLGLLVVDPLTGAMWELPNTLSTTLPKRPEAQTTTPSQKSLTP